MTGEEAKKAIDELKAQGNTDDEILGACYLMFADDKMTFEDLEVCANALGYEIADEFRNMSPEDQKTKGYSKEDDAEEGISEEEIEDAKEITSEEKEEEEDSKEEEDLGDDEKEEPKEDDAEESDDEKAKRLFGFGDKK